MINYTELARVRRELENILLLIDELEEKGVPKGIIIDKIIDEPEETDNQDEHPAKD